LQFFGMPLRRTLAYIIHIVIEVPHKAGEIVATPEEWGVANTNWRCLPGTVDPRGVKK